MKLRIYSAFATVFTLSTPAFAQLPKSARLFEQNCLMCHGPVKSGQTADATALRRMSPEAIVAAIGRSAAHEPLARLSDDERRAIAEYLAGRNFMAPNQPL
jgi:mono/diheme cytochrome c family protein